MTLHPDLDAARRPNNPAEARLMRMMCSAGQRCSCADENMQWRDATCAAVELHARRVAAADGEPALLLKGAITDAYEAGYRPDGFGGGEDQKR